MAISYLATGITASSDTVTPFANLSYTLPASTQTGDLLVAFYGGKPFGTVPSTPTDYTARSGGANGSTGMGAGTGSVYAVAFTKTHDGSESNPASTFSAQYSPGIRAMLAVRDSVIGANSVWSVSSCKGSDATATGTTYSATGDATLGYTVGDIVVVLLVHNDDSSGDSSFGLSIPGCTIQNLTQRLTGTLTTGTGNDGRMYAVTAEIETGTASGAPVVTATTGSGDSDGQSVFLLVRQTSVAAAGSLTLGGSAWGAAPAGATGGITLGGDAAASAPAAITATGSLTLGGAAAAQAPVAASGSLTLGGGGTGQSPVATSGTLTLGGGAALRAPVVAAGALSLLGEAAGQELLTGSGALGLGGTAHAAAPVTASGMVSLGGSVGALTGNVLGTISLSALATAAADAAAVGLLSLSGAVHVYPSASMAGQQTASAGMNAALMASATAAAVDPATATLTPASAATATITGSPSTTATIERS